MNIRTICVLLIGAVFFGAPAASMNFTPAAKQTLNFTVFRDDSPIGYHNFEFHPKGEQLEVEIDVELEVKLMFVTAFKFRHVASEVWENGRLLRMESETNDDGDPYKVKVKRLGEGLLVEVNGQQKLAPGNLLPSNLWNRDLLKFDKFLHPILGKIMPLKVSELGKREADTVGGEKLAVEGFVIEGGKDFRRELWYGADGRLIEVGFNAPKDGSRITYRLNDGSNTESQ